MKKVFIWIGIIIAAAFVFIGISRIYNNLSRDYSPDNLVETPTENTESQGSGTEQGEQEQPPENKAPDFTVQDAEGNEVKLSDYFGKPIVLNFWASWCPPCKAEMPHFQSAFEEHTDIQFLMINATLSDRESLELASEFVEKSSYTFPVLYDVTGEACMTYQTYSLPTTFFIDKDANLIAYAQGSIDEAALKQGIGMITEQESSSEQQ